MTERERRPRRPRRDAADEIAKRPSRDPSTNVPLNGPDLELEDKLRQLAGYRDAEDQGTLPDADDIDDLGQLTTTDVRVDELSAGVDSDLPSDDENLEMLVELELRDGETDDSLEATEEGLTYIAPMDPPTVPGSLQDSEVAAGMGHSALDEPYDDDHHADFNIADDEVSARVREALRADSATSVFADRIQVETRGGVVVLSGIVDDLDDGDNAVAVAEYVHGVDEVIDRLRIRSLGG